MRAGSMRRRSVLFLPTYRLGACHIARLPAHRVSLWRSTGGGLPPSSFGLVQEGNDFNNRYSRSNYLGTGLAQLEHSRIEQDAANAIWFRGSYSHS
jgi:hypothetical protein